MNRDPMQADVATRCIYAACARALPYRVNFCPYCGTGQHAGVMNPKHTILGEELGLALVREYFCTHGNHLEQIFGKVRN